MPNQKTISRTNNIHGSQQVVSLKVVTFDELWAAYPSDSIKHIDPKTGKDIFSDHCAINVSQALLQCGVRLKTFKGTRCWSCPTPDTVTRKGIHAIRAQELSDYLMTRPFAGCPKPLKLNGNSFKEQIDGKSGIIFFKDYWLRNNEKEPTGDHIDLWDKGTLAGSGYFSSRIRLMFPEITEYVTSLGEVIGVGRVTSLLKAKVVYFWEIK